MLILTSFINGQELVKRTAKVEKVGYRSFVITQYCLKGRTKSGDGVRSGFIAADLNVFSIGTRVYIDGLGQFIVKDSGSAIRGLKLDVWNSSCSGAIKFGRRTMKVKQI